MTASRAFTLIELLVVILIIGILAAIAIPQYRNAVDRAKLQECLPHIRQIEQAESLYKLHYGTYTSNLDLLGLDLPVTAHWTYSVISPISPAGMERIDMIDLGRNIWIERHFATKKYKCNLKGSTRMCILSGVVDPKSCEPRIYGEWAYHCGDSL
jgi:prepilin-type N-terminal cleavage/methylation domain-containing protein